SRKRSLITLPGPSTASSPPTHRSGCAQSEPVAAPGFIRVRSSASAGVLPLRTSAPAGFILVASSATAGFILVASSATAGFIRVASPATAAFIAPSSAARGFSLVASSAAARPPCGASLSSVPLTARSPGTRRGVGPRHVHDQGRQVVARLARERRPLQPCAGLLGLGGRQCRGELIGGHLAVQAVGAQQKTISCTHVRVLDVELEGRAAAD